MNALKYTAVHKLAQRGHCENPDSINVGNFVDLMKLIGQYNDTVGKKLTDLTHNAKYVSHNIQDEILAIMAKMIVNEIANEVREAGEFAIIADKSKDCSKTEQLSVVLHYLQSSSLDLSRAVDLIDVVVEDLRVPRYDKLHFEEIWREALSVCSSCGIMDLSEPGRGPQQPHSLTTRVRRLPPRLRNSVVMEPVGDRPTVDSKTTFKQHMYLPIMDTLLSELTKHLDSIQCAVMRGIEALNPCSDKFANLDQIQPFAEVYNAICLTLSTNFTKQNACLSDCHIPQRMMKV